MIWAVKNEILLRIERRFRHKWLFRLVQFRNQENPEERRAPQKGLNLLLVLDHQALTCLKQRSAGSFYKNKEV